ncbi:MAG: hypothetical protein R2825_27235 [Saprospiraceae bacterium]
MTQPPTAKSTGAPTAADQSWLAHAQKEKQETPKRLEDTAQFLVAIISISLTVFISNRPEGLADWTGGCFVWATVFWVVSALLSFFVLFPWRYPFNPDSPADIQRAYGRISNTKRVLLLLSVGCFLLALGMASFAFMMGFGD